MSATNKTTYYELPVFIATDEPKWLTDWNGAMNTIDGAIAEAKTAADNAQTTANANALAISGLSDSVSTISTALSTLTTTVNTLNGTVNTITELIGNGTPTTTDKTIIGAINELKAEIDALAPGGEVDAEDVSYDNTSSGLTASNVQAAIDELAQGGGAGGADLNLSDAHTPTITPVSGLSVTSDYTEAHILLNADKSLGKIYGGVEVAGTLSSGAGGWVKLFTLSNTGIETASQYNIVAGSCNVTYGSTDHARIFRMVFNTDGSVDFEVKIPASNNITAAVIPLYPCLYILKNLGD